MQVTLGTLVAGAGVGALLNMVPLYTSETGPRQVRGTLMSRHPAFHDGGILHREDAINFGNAKALRCWLLAHTHGHCFHLAFHHRPRDPPLFPNTPRYANSKGRVAKATITMAEFYGVFEKSNAKRSGKILVKSGKRYDLESLPEQTPWDRIYSLATGWTIETPSA